MNINFYDSLDREKIKDFLNYELNTINKSKTYLNNSTKNIDFKSKFPKVINNKEANFLNCCHEVNYNCIICSKGNLSIFYSEEKLSAEKLFNEFVKNINLCENFYFTDRDYNYSNVDKEKIIKFYEKNIDLYLNKVNKSLNNVVIQFKDYLNDQINEVSKITTQIFYNLVNKKKDEFNNIFMKIINNKNENIYNEVSFNKLIKDLKENNNNFLNSNNILEDFNKIIKIVNNNISYKKEFIDKYSKNNLKKNINFSKYLEIIKKSLNEILNFKDQQNLNFNELSKDLNIKYKDKLINYNPVNKELFQNDINDKNKYLIWDNLSKLVHDTGHNSSDLITHFEIIEGGRFILSVSKDFSLRLTNCYTNVEKVVIKNLHEDYITDLLWLPNSLAATCSKDGKIKLIDLFSSKILYELNKHTDWVNKIILVDQNYIVTASDDGYVKFISLNSLNVIKSIRSPDNRPVKTIIAIKNTNYLVIGSRKIYIYNYLRDIVEKNLNGHSSYIKHLEYDYDRNQLISIGDDQYFLIWNMLNDELIGKFTISLDIKSMTIFKSYYVFSTNDNYLYFWNPDLKLVFKKLKLKIFTTCLKIDVFNGLFYSQYNKIIQLKNINL